jgi:hypothetical protein
MLLPAACDSDLAHDWTGRACRTSEPRCLSGFVCNPQGRCVTPDQLAPSAGAGGAGGSATIEPIPDASIGGGGAEFADSGTPSDAGATPAPPRDAAVDGGSELDAGPDAAATSDAAVSDAGPELDACTPTVLYEDSDGDGYGNPDVSVIACASTGWVGVAGDCRDDLIAVHPNGGPSGAGYVDSNEPQGVSFDYDCSGSEEPDPTNIPSGAAPSCAGLADILACSSAGYVATARSGSNISSLCGSTTVVTCAWQTVLCGSGVQTDQPPYRCR